MFKQLPHNIVILACYISWSCPPCPRFKTEGCSLFGVYLKMGPNERVVCEWDDHAVVCDLCCTMCFFLYNFLSRCQYGFRLVCFLRDHVEKAMQSIEGMCGMVLKTIPWGQACPEVKTRVLSMVLQYVPVMVSVKWPTRDLRGDQISKVATTLVPLGPNFNAPVLNGVRSGSRIGTRSGSQNVGHSMKAVGMYICNPPQPRPHRVNTQPAVATAYVVCCNHWSRKASGHERGCLLVRVEDIDTATLLAPGRWVGGSDQIPIEED